MRSRATYSRPLDDVAEWLAALPSVGLRRGLVLVPTERQAHAIRRFVGVQRGQGALLTGIRFLRPLDLAREILARSGTVVRPGWEEIRRLRLLPLFDSAELDGCLRYFNPRQLRRGRGYAEAFARTIGDLEAGGANPALARRWAEALEDVDAAAAMRLHDVAHIWQVVDDGERPLFSAAEIFQRAVEFLSRRADDVRSLGPSLALLVGAPSTSLLRFLQALPEGEALFLEARPIRTAAQRWRRQLNLASPTPKAEPTARELGIVRRYLFEVPEVLTDPARARSSGIDETVSIEAHASLEGEVEAAAVWIGHRLEQGIPAEELALIVPDIDTYAPPLLDRLARLTADGLAPLAVHVAGGLPMATSPAGVRLMALLRALQSGLEAGLTLRLLPWLRHPNEGEAAPPQRLSPSAAARLVYETGIVGGTAPDPNGVGEWVERFTRRREALWNTANSVPDDASHQQLREKQGCLRVLKDIDHVLPGIAALQAVALSVQGGESLPVVWEGIAELCRRWIRLPPDPPNLLSLLADEFGATLRHPDAPLLRGASALAWILDALRRQRRRSSRFGMPAVFLGTPAQAAGLPFRAVRVLGLAEGVIPRTAHDDPILPDSARAAIEQVAQGSHADVVLSRVGDQVLDEIHDVFRVIQAAGEQLSLSVPRQSIDRSERETSAIILEVAAALGRRAGGNAGGDAGGDVPTANRLRYAYFEAAHDTVPALRSPRSQLAIAARQSSSTRRVPAAWTLPGARSLPRAVELHSAARAALLGPPDGMVASTWKRWPAPGLVPQRPVSATGVKLLLECPHRFLLERILFRREPPRRPPSDSLDPITYGNLFHAAASRFLQAHGAEVCKHDRDEGHWIRVGRQIAAECLDEILELTSVRGSDTRARERQRLLDQMESFIRYEWRAGSRNFYASEFEFGEPEPLEIKLERGSLYLRGAIDCVDQVSANALQVRDLKTGRVADFLEEPVNPGRDLQLGVYVLVLESLKIGDAAEVSLAAYVHPSATGEPDRQFVGIELDALRRATRAWLNLAHDLLEEGSFPRTPDERDCVYCPFVAACAGGAQAESAAKLQTMPAESVAGRFHRLKKQREAP